MKAICYRVILVYALALEEYWDLLCQSHRARVTGKEAATWPLIPSSTWLMRVLSSTRVTLTGRENVISRIRNLQNCIFAPTSSLHPPTFIGKHAPSVSPFLLCKEQGLHVAHFALALVHSCTEGACAHFVYTPREIGSFYACAVVPLSSYVRNMKKWRRAGFAGTRRVISFSTQVRQESVAV